MSFMFGNKLRASVVGRNKKAKSKLVASRKTTLLVSCFMDSSLRCHAKVHRNNLFIIARINVAVRERRMRPDHIAPCGRIGRFEQVGAADFLLTARSEPGYDQVAFFVEKKKSVAVFHDECVGPTNRPSCSRC